MTGMALIVWGLVVVPLGVTRAMQITLWDRITERPRQWLLRRLNPNDLPMDDPDRPYLSYLLECPWCSSVWIGLIVSAGLYVGSTRIITLLVLTALSASLAAVVIDRLIDVGPLSDEAVAARASEAAVRNAAPFSPATPPSVDVAFQRAERGDAPSTGG